ncbi:hypothetical protein [Reyranella massiliensis]|uniref:hypothetical protein n=1 Tax=Reyranella massiliensis TaxID=445220 RepID=UPI00030EBBAF|nr:hypothetical protein [Reyranella massiliensis]
MAEEATQTTDTTKAETTPTPAPVSAPTETKPAAPRSILSIPQKTEEAPTDEGEAPSEPKLLAGKYKNQEELEKGYLELEKSKRNGAQVPETYSFDELTKDSGIVFENDEQKGQFSAFFKEAGFSQEQIDKSKPAIKQFAENVARQAVAAKEVEIQSDALKALNLPSNPSGEVAKLRAKYGDKLDPMMESIQAWAKDKPYIWHAAMTADGFNALVYPAWKAAMGPDFNIDTDAGGADPIQLKASLGEITRNPAYVRPGSEGDRLRAEADKIAKRLAAFKR